MDAHAGEGRLRLRPFLDLARAADRDRLEPLSAGVYEIVLEAGGTISASQASGLVRTQFNRRQFGELIQVFREIKDAFDPMGLLNPGKVIGDDPHLMTRDLRPSSPGRSRRPRRAPRGEAVGPGPWPTGRARRPRRRGDSGLVAAVGRERPRRRPAIQPALIWPELEMLEMASACHGCGLCRTSEPTLRMCPSFRSSRMEAASPRAQANLHPPGRRRVRSTLGSGAARS